jgi:hypothetical protein
MNLMHGIIYGQQRNKHVGTVALAGETAGGVRVRLVPIAIGIGYFLYPRQKVTSM